MQFMKTEAMYRAGSIEEGAFNRVHIRSTGEAESKVMREKTKKKRRRNGKKRKLPELR